jgi:hypothetical protein
MYDSTKHEITFESNGVKDVYAVQSGSTETVHVVLDDDTERTFTFDIAIAGVTTDTQQTITARKIFTAPQTFSGGIEGTTMIDGDVQVSNGHSLSVAGDIDTAGDLQVAGNAEFLGNVEAGGMAIEESNGRTILSNPNGVRMEGELSLDAMTVAGMKISKSVDGPTVMGDDDPILIPNALRVRTTTTGTRDNEAVNGTRLQNDLDNYDPMVRTSGNQTVYGNKDLRGLTAISPARILNTGGSGYKILYRIKEPLTSTLLFIGGRTVAIAQIGTNGGEKGVLVTSGRPYDVPWLWVCVKNGEYFVVCRGLYSATMNIIPINTFAYGSQYNFLEKHEIIDQVTDAPVIGEQWDEVIEVIDYD